MLTKTDLENREEQWLKPYATLSKYSQGRVYPEAVSLTRTEFQRDRDRVIHSKAFRRLKHKTQVFIATERGDHYRTRLTHTLEVAQISRHLARVLGLNEDLAETIALAHDLGHTPFGHTGEMVLDELMKDCGGFEHNRQSKKIVEKLEKKYVAFDGLNLTAEVIDGLIKHRSPYDHPSAEQSGPSLEAQVTNIADEIAYNSHDLDDALSSGLLKLKDLRGVALWHDLETQVKTRYAKLSPQQIQRLTVRDLIDVQIRSVLEETEARILEYGIKNYKDVLNCQKTLVDFSEDFSPRIRELRKFLYERFYSHPKVVKKNNAAAEVITKLFKYYVVHPELISESSMFLAESTGTDLACDYVAGMTDQFALKEYRKLKRLGV